MKNLVLYNGTVHTMYPARARATALAIAGNRILAVGDDAEMRALAGQDGQAVDLRGGTVVPAFADSHLHFMSWGLSLRQINLVGVPALEQALARVAERAGGTPTGRWLTGRGWDHSLWSGGNFPTRHGLDGVAPDHPVWLRRKCGHVGWANSRALALAGITSDTPDPPGGAIERTAGGEPTGILKETAMDLVSDLIPQPTMAEAAEAIQAATAAAHRHGLVNVHTMEGPVAFRALQQLHAGGELEMRVLIQIPEENLDAAVRLGLRSGLGDERLRIGGVKIFADGALGARTAAMLAPYEGEPDNRGIAIAEGAALTAMVREASRAGLAVFVHAIGDRANREVLNAVEASQRAGEGQQLRHRIEHVQILHPSDVPRLARLGVVASMQPLHATQDMLLADSLWGKRCAGAYAWRSLLNSGAALAFGSDAPVEDLSVLAGIHAAVTRRRPDGSPGPEGWIPQERVSAAQALRAYTVGAAFASGEEAIKGSLAPGKFADVAILSRDILAIPAEEILETEVVGTLLDGKFVYRQEDALS